MGCKIWGRALQERSGSYEDVAGLFGGISAPPLKPKEDRGEGSDVGP